MKMHRIGFCSLHDQGNLPTHSDTHHYMLESLRKHFDVTVITPNTCLPISQSTFDEYLRSIFKGKRNPPDVISDLKSVARSFEEQVDQCDVSCLFFPDNEIVAFMEFKKPAIFCGDSLMSDRHSKCPNISRSHLNFKNAIRKKILSRPIFIQLPTFESIKLVYDKQEYTTAHMYDIPYGGNLGHPPSREEVLECRKSFARSAYRFLFVGQDWDKDGGKIAFEFIQRLNYREVPAELIACKCEVPSRFNHPQLKAVGPLPKGDPTQLRFLREQYSIADFVIMPKETNRTAIDVAEAAAWGLPIVGVNAGDMHFLIKDDENGYRINFNDDHPEDIELIKSVCENPGRYQELCVNSRQKYDSLLNWDRWGEKTANVIRSLSSMSQNYWRQKLPTRKEMAVRGRPFYNLNHAEIEIDVTYRCNLNCPNCSRSCGVASSKDDISISQIEKFIEESRYNKYMWTEIRLIGGEPTLHPDILGIIDMLLKYKSDYPQVRISISTNGYGEVVKRVLRKLPDEILIKNTNKTSPTQQFIPMNNAPVDSGICHNYSYGCLMTSCGLGLNAYGYYHCSLAGGIDRIFGYNIGRKRMPAMNDLMLKEKSVFCRVCGFFNCEVEKSSGKQITSKTWQKALSCYKRVNKRLSLY